MLSSLDFFLFTKYFRRGFSESEINLLKEVYGTSCFFSLKLLYMWYCCSICKLYHTVLDILLHSLWDFCLEKLFVQYLSFLYSSTNRFHVLQNKSLQTKLLKSKGVPENTLGMKLVSRKNINWRIHNAQDVVKSIFIGK